jgi:hypothetical protein
MPSVIVDWKGSCRDPLIRTRLLDYLHRLAVRSDEYLRLSQPQRPFVLKVLGEQRGAALAQRENVEVVDQPISGRILVSNWISPNADALAASARKAGLQVSGDQTEGHFMIGIEKALLRGLDFKLFDPRGLYPGADRMSFVFLECPDYPFLDGRLVEVAHADEIEGGEVGKTGTESLYLANPASHLRYYLEDWTDCLFSWVKFFFLGDLWWHRWEDMQGYDDYRGVFEQFQAERGREAAEEATFDAVLGTFCQHAEHWIGEVEGWAEDEKGHG